MFFFITILIVAIACSTITIKTLVGYSDMKLIYKILISAIIIIGWFAVLIMNFIRKNDLLPTNIYSPISHIMYGLTGFVFILFVAIILRDVVWYALYGIAKLLGKDGWYIDPQNISVLGKANITVVMLSILISAYSLYQGNKLPEVKEINVSSPKIGGYVKVAQISDLHITRATSTTKLQNLVHKINMLNPDVIVLTGDTIDDKTTAIEEQLDVLSNLSAPHGVYSVMGNHEFYNDVYAAKKILDKSKLQFLFNGGVHIKNSNVFIAGIPDTGTMAERINFWRTLNKSEASDYKVLLSHSPSIIDSLSKGLVDLVLSGHTHGGQIFPFHWFAKKANHYLAGRYHENGTDLYVSRGAGTWGPAMRLFAPSEITIINLLQK